jgi:pantetheine-phosphate adenylyltransferase
VRTLCDFVVTESYPIRKIAKFALNLIEMEKIAVFPGSFDPITRGHESVIRRALPLFDRIIVAIGENSEKKGYFPVEQRMQWLERVFAGMPNVEIAKYTGLTIDYCKTVNAGYLLRGLRTAADFEFERIIGLMNHTMAPGIETIFLLSEPQYSGISSSVVREIHRHGGDVAQFVPAIIQL